MQPVTLINLEQLVRERCLGCGEEKSVSNKLSRFLARPRGYETF